VRPVLVRKLPHVPRQKTLHFAVHSKIVFVQIRRYIFYIACLSLAGDGPKCSALRKGPGHPAVFFRGLLFDANAPSTAIYYLPNWVTVSSAPWPSFLCKSELRAPRKRRTLAKFLSPREHALPKTDGALPQHCAPTRFAEARSIPKDTPLPPDPSRLFVVLVYSPGMYDGCAVTHRKHRAPFI